MFCTIHIRNLLIDTHLRCFEILSLFWEIILSVCTGPVIDGHWSIYFYRTKIHKCNTRICKCEGVRQVYKLYLHLDLSFSPRERGTLNIKGLMMFAIPSDTIFYLLSYLVSRTTLWIFSRDIQHAVLRKCSFPIEFVYFNKKTITKKKQINCVLLVK